METLDGLLESPFFVFPKTTDDRDEVNEQKVSHPVDNSQTTDIIDHPN
jgi:hypothetical protein